MTITREQLEKQAQDHVEEIIKLMDFVDNFDWPANFTCFGVGDYYGLHNGDFSTQGFPPVAISISVQAGTESEALRQAKEHFHVIEEHHYYKKKLHLSVIPKG
jgi:hypothetical protein